MDRSHALFEIFEQSGGKESFTIKTLTDAAERRYPHLFTPRPNPSTITRAVEQLMERSSIRQDTAASAPSPIAGRARQSPRQLAWTYVPGMPVLQSLEQLSDVKEKLNALISLAIATESIAPLSGFRFHDGLAQLGDLIVREKTLANHARRVKNAIAKYGVGTVAKKKRRGSLEENRKRDILRTLDQCVSRNLRLRIHHRHVFSQNEEVHVLEPLGFYERNASVFLIAYTVTDRPELKQWKLDRIEKAENLLRPTEFEFDGDGQLTGRRWPRDLAELPPFPLDKIFADSIHNYIPPPGDPQALGIEILVDKRLAKWVIEEMIHPRQKTTMVTLSDGTKALKVVIEKAYVNEITPRLLGLGQYVKVISPSNLANEVYQRLAAAARQYEPRADTTPDEGGKPPAPAPLRSSRSPARRP
jgi:predicted DNA-binding transcriptional regulator YafY